MNLKTGDQLAVFDIVEPIGAGGMGEVYKARDTKLGREVAIKVLPEAFAENKERLARFEREARLLASLNHPNIATLFELQESDGIHFLVMELVPGETLADRITGGPIPVDEALSIFKQIAEALEAAHDKGVIHRDLKPANIKVTPEGKAKVLDFGLAKAMEPEVPVDDSSQSPTLTKGTALGAIMGTAAYMSPEQARGKPVNKRTDIWAFGCCLYEALTGRKAFEGDTVTDTLAAIVNKEPDWDLLSSVSHSGVQRLLPRCLTKDPSQRLRDIADARFDLEGTSMLSEPGGEASPIAPSRRALAFVLVALISALLGLVVGILASSIPPSTTRQTRLSVKLPRQHLLTTKFNPLILSPNGDRLVYMAHEDGNTQLFMRLLDRFEVNPIPGTEGAENPIFSPDGQWVGFFADGKLQKVSVRGGAPVVICDAPSSFFYIGASWGDDDHIVFSGGPASGLFRVSASGGTPKTLTTPDPAKGENTHAFPQVLPKSNAVIFTVWGKNTHIATLSLNTGEQRALIPKTMEIEARYIPGGHLVFTQMASLMAVPFDPDRLELKGPAVPVLDGVYVGEGTGFYSVSGNGSLVYMSSSGGTELELVWVDRDGTATPIIETEKEEWPRLSPDGNWLAISSGVSPERDIWIYELARGTRARFTIEGDDLYPVWSPDGRRVAFASNRSGDYDIYWKPADGSAVAEPLLSRELFQFPMDWSPDGRFLIFYEPNPNTRADIWILPLAGDRTPIPFITTPFNDSSPSFSSDGRFLAYVSDESGRNEIYVQSFPDPSGKVLVSKDGGTAPVWSPSGRELFYRNGDRMVSVAVDTEPSFKAGRPQLLFEGRYLPVVNRNYDVFQDGQRFVMVRSKGNAESTELNVVLNWFDELKRLVPTN